MESAQEVRKGDPVAIRSGCFNPCCNGKCSGSGIAERKRRIRPCVSILVVMESAQEDHTTELR